MAAKEVKFANLINYWQLYLLVLPSALLVAVLAYFPCVSGIYHAFYRWNGDYINEFVGLANFRELATDPVLWRGFGTIAILVVANLFQMIPSILTAVAINRLKNHRVAYLYKVLFVVPMIIPSMVILLMWKFFFEPTIGVLNQILSWTGLMELLAWLDVQLGWGGLFTAAGTTAWLGEPALVVPSLIIWGFPWVGTAGVLIYLAGLQAIDESIYEAAEIDGINSFHKFCYIELPLILTQVRINLILMIVGTIQMYGLILILFDVSGGPDGVALVPGLYMYRKAFVEGQAGYACAIGIVLFAFILVLTSINNRLVRIEK